MTPKKELHLAFALAGILLVVGILSYAAYSAEPPKEPLRVMYHIVTGNVMFNHKAHVSPEGYGLSCGDCHHHPPDEPDLRACSDCHQVTGEDGELPEACLDCHDSDEIEGVEMISSGDAAHEQCRNCHDQYGAGPGTGNEDCGKCHIKPSAGR